MYRSFFFSDHSIKQIDSMFPCVCSVINHRGRQNVVKTSLTHSPAARVPSLFLPHFDVIYDLLGQFTTGRECPVDDGKAREEDRTRLPVPNVPLCYWSSQLFNSRAPSSTYVPVLLLNQPITEQTHGNMESIC